MEVNSRYTDIFQLRIYFSYAYGNRLKNEPGDEQQD